jgi:hypothetical protein
LIIKQTKKKIKVCKPSSDTGIRSSKAVLSVNPRWTNLILYGIDGDKGTRPWKVKVNEQKIKYIVMIFIYEKTVL